MLMGLLDRMRKAWEDRGWGEHSPEEQAEADRQEQDNIDKGWPSGGSGAGGDAESDPDLEEPSAPDEAAESEEPPEAAD